MSSESAGRPATSKDGLLRELGPWDGALITIGSVIGTGIFITSADVARVVPHAGLFLLVWLVGGLLTLTGALTYAELGVLYPEAGGMYVFLKEAYGRFWGFLYGWGAFLIIMSGGLAALAVAFGIYLGSFVPFFGVENVLLSAPIGGWTWNLTGAQVAGAAAILVLTTVNALGVREGAGVQNAFTILKVGGIAAFVILGFVVTQRSTPDLGAAIPGEGLLAAFGVAMIAVLWTFDGWNGLTFSAGEIRNPERNLPIGLIAGTGAILLLYMGLNAVYLRAMPVEAMGATTRIGEAAARALFGTGGAQAVAAGVVVSTFGCLSATILYSSRIYLPMARDGVFFRSLGRVHPKTRVPVASLWAQSAWAIVLTLSGTYEQLYTYVVFAAVLFHVGAGAAVFVLRRTRPDAPRPYRVPLYPWIPLVFLVSSAILVLNTLLEKPLESIAGLGLLALGIPAYLGWRRAGQG